MGGNIAWTIRKADGTEFRMSRWTNIFPDIITDEFLAGNPKAFVEATEHWLDMKEDWETHGPNGPFKFNMTSVYAPYPYGLKPDEYGFIVVDFQTKTLISCNYYSNFNHIWAMPWWWHDEEEKEEYSIRINQYQKMFKEGRILNYWEGRILNYWHLKNKVLTKHDLPKADDFADLVEKCSALINDIVVNFDFSPPNGWTFKTFNYDKLDERKRAYSEILNLGFSLSKEEKSYWDEWLK